MVSESDFCFACLLYAFLSLTANLLIWKLHVLGPTDHNHIHCRFLSKKHELYRLCCCPKKKQTKNNKTTNKQLGRGRAINPSES